MRNIPQSFAAGSTAGAVCDCLRVRVGENKIAVSTNGCSRTWQLLSMQ